MSNLSNTTMLIRLTRSCWSGVKTDKRVSSEVAANYGTTEDVGKYVKNLLCNGALDAIKQAHNAIYLFHCAQTLPWLDSGLRIGTATNLPHYKTGMIALLDTAERATNAFVSAYPTFLNEAEQRHLKNGLFNRADYPEPSDIAKFFSVKYRILPMPDTNDFRCNISAEEREIIKAEIEEDMESAANAAIRHIYVETLEEVKRMADRLSAYAIDPQTGKANGRLHATVIDNLKARVDLIPRLNFTGDMNLEAIRADIERELTQHNIETLKNSDSTREDVAKKAQAIADRISQFMA